MSESETSEKTLDIQENQAMQNNYYSPDHNHDHVVSDTKENQSVQDYYVLDERDNGDESDDSSDIERELQKILEQKRKIEEMKLQEIEEERLLDQQYDKHLQDAKLNVTKFLNWAKNYNLNRDQKNDIYMDFCRDFISKDRIALFENICEFFKDENIVTNEIIFYWKMLIIALLKSNRKYKNCIDDLTCDLTNKSTNLNIIKEKYMFKCFVQKNYMCLFKENGNDYYVN